jgi:hypothetical protein
MTGSAGSDVYIYTSPDQSSGANVDTITDFSTGDVLQISHTMAAAGTFIASDAGAVASLGDTGGNLTGVAGQMVFITGTNQLALDINGSGTITGLDYRIGMTSVTAVPTTAINFIITGNAGSDLITTLGGADTINMTTGDTVDGGAGLDTFAFAAATTGSTITGGAGADVVTLAAGNNTLAVTDTDGITVTTSTGNLIIAGTGTIAINALAMATETMAPSGTGAFTITNWDSTGTLTDTSTSAISVTLAARATGTLALGADTTGTDAVIATALTDTQVVTMTGSNDATVSLLLGDLSAAAYAGTLSVTAGGVGGLGSNIIETGSGNDTINAGGGVDSITAGAGADRIELAETTDAVDTVAYSAVDTTVFDTITGFSLALDVIDWNVALKSDNNTASAPTAYLAVTAAAQTNTITGSTTAVVIEFANAADALGEGTTGTFNVLTATNAEIKAEVIKQLATDTAVALTTGTANQNLLFVMYDESGNAAVINFIENEGVGTTIDAADTIQVVGVLSTIALGAITTANFI